MPLPSKERQTVGVAVGLRPWTVSMVSGLPLRNAPTAGNREAAIYPEPTDMGSRRKSGDSRQMKNGPEGPFK